MHSSSSAPRPIQSLLWRILSAAVLSTQAIAQQQAPVITTVTGADFVFRGDGEPATQAQLSQIYHVLADLQGNVLVADRENHQIVRISPQGILRVIAGNGIAGFSGDGGLATRASLSFPAALALDAAGNIYIADSLNHRVRRLSPDGTLVTVAGNGNKGSAGDGGPAVNAELDDPSGLAVDRAGVLYIADKATHRIRRVNTNGTITHFAGTGLASFGGDNGPVAQAAINEPRHLAFDNAGNLYIADSGNQRVRRVTPQGTIATFAGTGQSGSEGDGGPATAATLVGPTGVFADSNGNVYVSEFFSRVRVINPAGTIAAFAGNGRRGFAGDGGPAANAQLSVITGISGDTAGNIYIADAINLRVRRVNAQRTISTIAGLGQHRYSGDGGPAVSASLAKPFGLALDRDGNLFVSDPDNHRVRKIDPRGTITTFAGTGTAGLSADGGPANQAALNFPLGIAVDAAGNLYISDVLNERVRRVNRSGVISTFAGGGTQRFPVDGAAASQVSLAPQSLAVDGNGTLYVLDPAACVIFRVTPDARVFRHAGTYGTCGSAGDGGPARNATIHPSGSLPGAISADNAGNVYLAEPNPPANAPPGSAGRVRLIDSAGTIRAFAGNGTQGFLTDLTPALQAPMLSPESVLADPTGALIGDGPYIYAMSQGLIFRLAGDVLATESGDGGAARSASLFGPTAMAIDDTRLFFVDSVNIRVRAILFSPPGADVSPGLLSLTGSSGGPPTPVRNLSLTSAIPGIAYATTVTTSAPWLSISPERGTSPRLIEVTANPADLQPGLYTAEIAIETPLATPIRRTVAVTFQVGPAVPPKLSVDNPSISFTLPRQAADQTRTLLVSNDGGGVAPFNVSVTTTNGGAWLVTDPTSGRALPGQPVSLTVTAKPGALAPGTYVGRVTIAGPGEPLRVAVTMTISANDRAILLSQSGLSFTTVSGGGVVPPRSFEVLNPGRSGVEWAVSTSTLEGGQGWLNVSRTAGTTNAGSPQAPSVDVRVNQAGLAPGVYYGLVRVDAPGAANSPQVITIGHEVLPQGSDPGALVDPAELVFTTLPGASPSSREVLVYNVAQSLKTFRSTGELAGALLASLPKDQTLELNRPTRVIVQPFTAGLAAGIYRGGLNLQFTDGRVRVVRVRVIVAGAGAGTLSSGRKADGCSPTRLLPAVTSLAASFSVTAGWPIPLNVEVRDDCGGPQEAGSVVVSFSNGDAPVPLQSLQGGRWAGTWASRAASENTTLKVEASVPAQRLAGTESLNITVRAQQVPPTVSSASVVSAAGFESYAPIAPGGMITIFGDRLADAVQQASTFPIPTRLATTRVLIGGKEAPLLFVNPTQVNALVPTGIDVNTRHQLLVQRGNALSQAVSLDMAAAQPAVFLAGGGGPPKQGIITWIRPGQPPTIATPANPARAGDVIVIYGSGLGATNPEVPAGEQTPSTALSPITGSITLRIGGVEAPVDFAGLAPGFGGLYQINARVPAGVTGDAVEVVITRADLVSPLVTMAVR